MARASHPRHSRSREVEGLWLGPIVSEAYLQSDSAASPAGNHWQGGLVGALQGQGHGLRAIAGAPHAAWPRGRLFARGEARPTSRPGLDATLFGYLNLPIVKLLHQRENLRRLLAGELRRSGVPRVVLSYNAGYPEAAAGRWLQLEHGVPWVCVVADYPESSDPRFPVLRRNALDVYSRLQQRWIRAATGRVYLSWGLYERETLGPKFHLDGGVAAVRRPVHGTGGRKRVVMYSGTLSAHTGVDLLLDAFRQVPDRDCELWICGRGNLDAAVRVAAAADPRIHFFGLVSRGQLDDLMSRAHLFVNPRPSALPENRANFPSKLLEYLSWCRPVVSTMTPGIAPRYRSVLKTVADETAHGLAAVISASLDQTVVETKRESERIRSFVEEHLLWSVQARRLWSWLETECGVSTHR